MNLFEPATKPSAEFHEWDPRYARVARAMIAQLEPLCSGVTFEHVGSTAVCGCGGKGVIDLLAMYVDGALEPVKSRLLSLGLANQGPEFARPWSESRPMYLGFYSYAGVRWLVYVHVVQASSDEVRRFRDFKTLLNTNPELVAAYCQLKRDIVASGTTDTDDYAVQKQAFLRSALGALHALRG